jgi:hypothetical protein
MKIISKNYTIPIDIIWISVRMVVLIRSDNVKKHIKNKIDRRSPVHRRFQ